MTTMPADQGEAPAPVRNKKWTSRRRGACDMCKSKKVRCDGATPCRYCELHNLNCEYQISKKQRSTNKSPTQLTTEQGPVDPLLSEDTCDSGVTTLAGSPSDVSILQDTTATKTGVNNSVAGNANNSLQDMMLAPTHDRHIMPVMFDRYTNDVSTACMDWMGHDHLGPPFPIDMTSLGGTGTLPWSPPRGNYSEADFDIPYPVEHSTDATNTIATNTMATNTIHPSPVMGLSMLHNSGQMNDKYDRKVWEEVSAKLAKSGLAITIESMPRIDFSLAAIFSTQTQQLGTLGRSQHDEVDRIFKRLSGAQAQMSFGMGSEQYDNNYARWYWSDPTLMEKCKTACFEEPLGISTFLTRAHFDEYLRQATESTSVDSLVVRPLIDSVMAFGLQALAASSQNPISSDLSRKAIAQSRLALSSRDTVQRSPDTLLKMQTLLSMTIISEQIDHRIYGDLLSCAVSCARTRKFMNFDSVDLATAQEKEYQARRSLWYFYSIEVVHSIRCGMPPILTRDWTDCTPPEAGKDTDWLLIKCQYANALSSAADMLYSQKALRQTMDERERNLTAAYKIIESWRTSLPIYLQNIHKHETGYVTLDDQRMRHLALSMVHRYHEAIFITFFPWTGSDAKNLVSDHCRKKSMELCVRSAQAVLAIAARISSFDILDSKLINLIAVSICVLFLDIVASGSKKSLPYLSMGCGIFGSLSLDNELPLADALELTRLAQQSRKT